ncbi:MAG: GIY-YIG nuclease family protein [Bacilli bacterium]
MEWFVLEDNYNYSEKNCHRGIYEICNLKNGNRYIGQSVNVARRLDTHQKELFSNSHCNKHLQSAFNKYGIENFAFRIIETCDNVNDEDLMKREQYWIDYYGGVNSNQNYNLRDAALGGHLSDELKTKISNSEKGKIISKEQRIKNSIATKIQIKIFGNPFYGKKHSRHSRQLQSINHPLTGKTNYALKGRIHINNGNVDKMVQECEFEFYLKLGYTRGMKKKNKREEILK